MHSYRVGASTQLSRYVAIDSLFPPSRLWAAFLPGVLPERTDPIRVGSQLEGLTPVLSTQPDRRRFIDDQPERQLSTAISQRS